MRKFVYSFNEGSRDMAHLLGSKGADLAEMTKMGLPVPFGFTITAEGCAEFCGGGGISAGAFPDFVEEKIKELEIVTGRVFGDSGTPLLVSVRAGAEVFMPGMLDTILDLGLNDKTAEAFAEGSGDRRFAYDCYRRFLQMFGIAVYNIPRRAFALPKKKKWYSNRSEIASSEMEELTERFKAVIFKYTGKRVPSDPRAQLAEAVRALFLSWGNEKAVLYRKLKGIPDDPGISVTVQAMVFGNLGENSGTGVVFTRSPLNGENKLFGQFLANAQGEDLAGGHRTPKPLDRMKARFPKLYRDLEHVADVLEKHYKEVQHIEFTIEKGSIYILQTRAARQTAFSAVKTSADMVEEGYISKNAAILRLRPDEIYQLLHPFFGHEAEKKAEALGTGLPASPGAAAGRIRFSTAGAKAAAGRGEKVILVRQDTSPADFSGMVASEGILTARGGTTSYASMVARSMGKCCVAGCPGLVVNETDKTVTIGETTLKEGEEISLDGSKGIVYRGMIKIRDPKLSEEFNTVMAWADDARVLKLRANADNAEEAGKALMFGAEGIGLLRTESMFFTKKRADIIRDILLARTDSDKREVTEKLLPYQKRIFTGIYEIMEDKPVSIRLLDHSLYEFFLRGAENMEDLAKLLEVSYKELRQMASEYYESNAVLGHRGCRLAVSYPEIIRMQVRAVTEAALEVSRKHNFDITPMFMIPLVGIKNEMTCIKSIIKETVDTYLEKENSRMEYFTGALIEVPRAALIAGKIAEEADFITFGTNDLTQLVYGFSRNDTGDLIKGYLDKGIFADDPFQVIDEEGVGELLEIAVKRARQVKPGIKIGVCGEHGGDPKSIEFFHRIGLNYVSCSPYRIPVARIAAAQAAIRSGPGD